jgi:poly(3-hydroxyalkanoate) synthetase
MTAGLHRDFLDLGLRNSLVHPGEARMLGAPVDLSSVAVDGYVVAGVADHISPWQNCYRSAQLFGGRTRFALSTSGHIAAIVNPPTNRKASYQIAQDLRAEADEWARTTETTSGSWWPDFLAWLAARSGPERAAPTELGRGGMQPLAPAPGTYVLDR